MPPNKPLPTSSDTLPDQSVTTDKLVDLAVTTDKLADSAITSAKQALTGSKSQPARLLDTIYQNLTGKLILVVVAVELTTPLNTDSALVQALNDTVTPPVVEVDSVDLAVGVAALHLILKCVFIVPNNSYYEMKSTLVGTGTATLKTWTEYAL